MDNPQDQPGTPNAGRNPQNQPATPGNPRATTGSPESTASGAATASRKSAPMPNAQANQSTTGSPSQQPTGADRQGKDQQSNNLEGQFLDTAVQNSKKWIEGSGVLNSVNQLPQALKNFGNRAVARVGDLSTTQKVVGGALLAVGLGWLATRKGKSDESSALYNYGRAKSGSYGRQSYGYQAPDASTNQRTAFGTTSRSDSGTPYGNSGSRYGGTSQASGNTGIQSGSGRYESGSGFGDSASTEHGAQPAKGGSHSSSDDFGSSSNE